MRYTTQQKQLEELIRLQTAIFEQLPDGCVIVDAISEKIIYLNPSFTRITGYSASDISSQKPASFSIDQVMEKLQTAGGSK